MPELKLETALKRRRVTQKTLDRLAREVLTASATIVENGSRHSGGYQLSAVEATVYGKEKAIITDAVERLCDLASGQQGTYPPYDTTGTMLYEAAIRLSRGIERAFVESPHCMSMRDADTIAGMLHHEERGLEDAFARVIPPLQFSGTPADRAIATWFWDRYVERMQAQCTGCPIR